MLNLNFIPFPVLYTERLVLRRIHKKDAAALLGLRSDKSVMQFIDRPRAKTMEDALQLIVKIEESLKNNYGITWAICFKNDEAMIGTLGFWRIEQEHYRAEIGYMLNASLHSKGIMHEAVQPALDYAFNGMRLHSVEANINPGNTASMKLLEKNGFIKEAYFRENFYYDGKFLDSIIYSLLEQDYTQRKL